MLLHLIDATQDNPDEAYLKIRGELEAYAEHLADKPEVIALTKADSLLPEQVEEARQQLAKVTDTPIEIISSVSGQNVKPVLRKLARHVYGEDDASMLDDEPSDSEEGWTP